MCCDASGDFSKGLLLWSVVRAAPSLLLLLQPQMLLALILLLQLQAQ